MRDASQRAELVMSLGLFGPFPRHAPVAASRTLADHICMIFRIASA